MLFPHLAGVVIERVEQAAGGVLMWVSSTASEVACHACGHSASRVHSRYDRRLADAPIAGRTVVLRVRVRRFFCDSTECAVRTFTEQPAGVATRHARRTPLSRAMLTSIGVALAGRAGARLAAVLGLSVSRNTLLRLLQGLPEEPIGEITALGVDDFAIRKGQTYATILINLATHQPIDVLPDREADTLVEWLKAHPEIQFIARDRAGAYAEASTRGAPQATQCADRWHLWKNLGEAVEKTVIAHRTCRSEPVARDDAGDDATGCTTATTETAAPRLDIEPTDSAATSESSFVTRMRERYAAVRALHAEGMSIRAITQQLRLDRKTVRRIVQADDVEDLIAKTTSRYSLLDNHKPYLNHRWTSGHTNTPSARPDHTTRWCHCRIARPTENPARHRMDHARSRESVRQDSVRLKEILARCPELDTTRRHVDSFASMIRDLTGDRITDWMDRVRDNLPALHSFVKGLRQDLAAVTAGLTLPWSNGRAWPGPG